jgi:hypothetical protein
MNKVIPDTILWAQSQEKLIYFARISSVPITIDITMQTYKLVKKCLSFQAA